MADPAWPSDRSSAAARRRARRRLRLRARIDRRAEADAPSSARPWMLAVVVAVALITVLIGVAAVAAYTIYRGFADDLQEPDAIVDTQRSLGTSRIFDRDGQRGALLFEFADPLTGLNDPVRLSEVSRYMIDATVATEDSSFWDNEGINLRGLLRAAWENFGVGSSDFLGGSGGSSITQQLVKNVLIPVEERSGRTIERVRGKIKETILAVELTGEYSKEQILEWYLNSIFYGNFSYGIGAASQRYFGKPPAELTLAEAAMLAGLPQAPSLYNPIEHYERGKRRQADVLDLMARHSYISQAEADAAKLAPLAFDSKEFEITAPHFVLYVRDELLALCERGQIPVPDSVADCDGLLSNGGLRITTSLDMRLQRLAEREIEWGIASFEADTGAHNGSLIALDPANGQIRAMVGSRDFFAEELDGQVNLATALHSPGSSIKPLTYLAAFQLDPRAWHPGAVIWDVPTRWEEFDGTVFEPTNFDERFRGPVTVRSALANSMNIPAFRVAAQLGVPYLLDTLHQLGITTMSDPADYGPSITLGGGDVSLLDMTYVYAAISQNGVMRGQPALRDRPSGYRDLDPVAILEVRDARGQIVYRFEQPDQRAVARPQQSYQITHILSDNQARSLLYGLNSNLVLDRPAAAKTGTAGDPGQNDVRIDYWTIGYTPQLTVGVWVGNADNEPMTGGSSSRTAGLIWRNVMLAAHAGLEPAQFEPPPGIAWSRIYAPQIPLWRGEGELRNGCQRIVEELFVSPRAAAPLENGVCLEAQLDRRTLQTATDQTPAAFVEEGHWLQPPADDPAAAAWLRENHVAYLRSGSTTEADAPLRLDAPLDGAVVARGPLLVTGRAASDEQQRWTLTATRIAEADEADAELTGPIQIAEQDTPIESGVLARWDTSTLPAGVYALRLTVVDRYLGSLTQEIHIALPAPQ